MATRTDLHWNQTSTQHVPLQWNQLAARDARAEIASLITNTMLSRSDMMSTLLGSSDRDIFKECQYPENPTIDQYRKLYDREGIAKRIVSIFPDECWAVDPIVKMAGEKTGEGELESAWNDLDIAHNLNHYLHRIDVTSGVGSFGCLLIGIDDGKKLEDPVSGFDANGPKEGRTLEHKIIYLRALDQSVVEVNKLVTDKRSPRYGLPEYYTVKIRSSTDDAHSLAQGEDSTDIKIHWSRIIHVADNRHNSEVFGVPRLKPVYNRIYDLQKLYGGSAEMFWKGGFPGFSFEVNPDLETDIDFDADAMREEFSKYSEGLQRYMAVLGVKVQQLAPQVASPKDHIDVQLKNIAITSQIPFRMLLGTEAAQLASSQDEGTWNKRLQRRQRRYLTPNLVRPFIIRLMQFGALPLVEPKDIEIKWPDLKKPTFDDRVSSAQKFVTTLVQYINNGVEDVVPPRELFQNIMGFTQDEADAILQAAEDQLRNPDLDFREAQLESELHRIDEIAKRTPDSGGNE